MSGFPETFVAVAAHEASKGLIRYAIKRYRKRKIWRLCAPEKAVVVLSADRAALDFDGDGKDDPTLKLRPGAGAAHARALLIAGLSLQNAYGFSTEQVRLSADGSLHEDLVLLGSPDHNGASGLVLAAARKPYPDLRLETFANAEIGWRIGTGAKYFGGTVHGEPITHDFGVILRMENPFAVGERRRAILLAGCTTFGTLAAVRVFTELLVDKYKPAMQARGDFACLIETNVVKNDDTISGVNVIDFQPLHRSNL